MGVADEPRFVEPVQGQVCPGCPESAAQVLAPQRVEYLDLEEMRYVQGLVWPRNPLPDVLGFRIDVQQDGNRRRRIENDQEPLTEIAGVVSVAHPADGNVRGLVELDWLIVC